MNSFLLYKDRTIANEKTYPSFQDIYKDLNLNILLKTMAQDNPTSVEYIRSVMMVPIHNQEELEYRHDVILDLQANRDFLDTLYQCALTGYKKADIYKKEKEQNRGKSSEKIGSMISAIRFLGDALLGLKEILSCLDHVENKLQSKAFLNFFQRLEECPLQEFFEFYDQLSFAFTGGESLYSIQMSGGLKLSESTMISCKSYKKSALTGTARSIKKWYYKVAQKDKILIENESLLKDLNYFKECHLIQLVERMNPFLENLIIFYYEFLREITFYKGVVDFSKRMKELSLPLCFGKFSQEKKIDDLYELSLALYTQSMPITNSLRSSDSLTIITGANQGGKSTFLRSFGIAQIMLQCGMPIPAASFESKCYSRIHTHFTRKEDAMLSQGRLEEELKRMNDIVYKVEQDSLILLNESFASTTEKEGSKIAEEIILPLFEKNVHVMMVTHLHEFALKLYEKNLEHVLFLLAERTEDGTRTYHMIPGKPHYSSYGTDLFKAIFEN